MERSEIAYALGISLKTVDYAFNGHARDGIFGICDKIGTYSLPLMIQWALRNGIAEWKV